MKKVFLYLLFLIVLAGFISCEKEIEVDIPPAEIKLVVEGSIEQGGFPILLLTRSQGYFEPTDLSTLESLFVHDAEVYIRSNGNEVQMQEICSDDIPDDLLPLVTELTGFTEEQLAQFNLCAYTTFDSNMVGQEGSIYELEIFHEEDHLTARTKIPPVVALDSVWFQLAGANDSLGFAHAILNDPDTIGNAYRWLTKRINRYPEWSQHAGEQKDAQFLAPLGSVNTDDFFNGLEFEFAYNRPAAPNSSKEDDAFDSPERGFFKVGDTVAVRGCTIDQGVFRYLYDMESQLINQGSPFAVPFDLRTNINGGLGIWAGYGVFNDTIVCGM